MAEFIEMPKLSDTMEVGVLAGWSVKVGDSVSPDSVLAEVETDKATMEVPAYFDGVVLYLRGQAGDQIPLGGLMAIIGKAGEDVDALLKQYEAKKGGSAAPVPAVAQAAPAAATVGAGANAASAAAVADERLKASPLAKKMAHDLGVDLRNLAGTGEGGRVVRRDVEAAALAPATPAPTGQVAAQATPATAPAVLAMPLASNGAGHDDQRISQMRHTIARRLSESKFTAPHFYLTVAIDMTRAAAFRQQVQAELEVKFSFNDLVIKASAMALRKHPAVNSSWLGEVIRHHHHVNIGVAVAVPEGLVVPVVHHADQKGLTDIALEVRELAGLAREKKIRPEQMQGNTFSISNLGMFGIEEFTAIINPPDACILAVGSIREVPVVRNGALAVGQEMKVTLSCDHRVVDGATGAQFLQTLKSYLENPVRMLV